MEKILQTYIVNYGVLPLILAIDFFENEEKYEVCNNIKAFIEQFSKKYNIPLKTKLNAKEIKDFFEDFKKQTQSDISTEHLIMRYIDYSIFLIQELDNVYDNAN